jgi:predicted ATPase/DNA-binding winged helix-turn-helix (wHTH) protein
MKQFGTFRLDTANECLWDGGTQIALALKPFAVLRYLVEHPGRLITHNELLDALWPETYVQPQILRTYMLELRKVLHDDAAQPRFIQTLPKRGYCFVGQVTKSAETPPCAIPSTALPETARIAATPVAPAAHLPIVGREEELNRLRRQLPMLVNGQRQIAFVTGEAGIGKTALVDTFAREAASSLPATVACGQCVEGFGWKEAYYPVMEALGQLCATADGERACRILARMAPDWLAALGREDNAASLSKAASPSERQSGQRMAGELCAALEEIASEQPLILIFEDLHWADDATLQLISALARRRAAARLMLVATYRPHDRSAEQPLLALMQDLLMRRLCIDLALAPLARTAVRELLTRELGQEALPPGLSGFVHQHSEGNPLFAIGILEHLIGQRYLVCEKSEGVATWVQRAAFPEMESGVPEGLAQMIELKVDRLSADEQQILEAGSLIHVAFPAWTVAAALEKDPSEIEDECDRLARRLHFLRRAGQDELPDGTTSAFYVFTHGLYREVLYQRQSSTRRARRHIRIAEKLGQLFQGREASVAREMAMHFEAAADWRRAANALRIAAGHAIARTAFAEATQLLERALRLTENLSETEQVEAAPEIHGELIRARLIMRSNSTSIESDCLETIPT